MGMWSWIGKPFQAAWQYAIRFLTQTPEKPDLLERYYHERSFFDAQALHYGSTSLWMKGLIALLVFSASALVGAIIGGAVSIALPVVCVLALWGVHSLLKGHFKHIQKRCQKINDDMDNLAEKHERDLQEVKEECTLYTQVQKALHQRIEILENRGGVVQQNILKRTEQFAKQEQSILLQGDKLDLQLKTLVGALDKAIQNTNKAITSFGEQAKEVTEECEEKRNLISRAEKIIDTDVENHNTINSQIRNQEEDMAKRRRQREELERQMADLGILTDDESDCQSMISKCG